MADIFDKKANDDLLLVNATNAYNSINRSALLHNIKYICLLCLHLTATYIGAKHDF